MVTPSAWTERDKDGTEGNYVFRLWTSTGRKLCSYKHRLLFIWKGGMDQRGRIVNPRAEPRPMKKHFQEILGVSPNPGITNMYLIGV